MRFSTLTVTRLGLSIDSALARTLRSTNPIESMLSVSRERARNVKRWRGGEIVLRWTAAGMLDAERSSGGPPEVPPRTGHPPVSSQNAYAAVQHWLLL